MMYSIALKDYTVLLYTEKDFIFDRVPLLLLSVGQSNNVFNVFKFILRPCKVFICYQLSHFRHLVSPQGDALTNTTTTTKHFPIRSSRNH